MIKSATTKERILQILAKSGPVSGSDLARELSVSRQAVHRQLRKLVEAGAVSCRGATRSAVYELVTEKVREPGTRKTSRTFALEGLEEDRVYRNWVDPWFSPVARSPEAQAILHYTFTEMLNNAIDHSGAQNCRIELNSERYHMAFCIRDYGIGIFRSIAEKLKLNDEADAVRLLLQGKTTTMPDRHSGEGIFFTSRAAESLRIRSHRLLIHFDTVKDNVIVEERKLQRGTEVVAFINPRTRRVLQELFGEYAPEEFDYRFSKTEVRVKLQKSECVSRSEARRLLSGLDRFRVVMLDFRGVKQLGQGFADEVFRVWQDANPDVRIETMNLSPSLAAMVEHVVDK
jgi:DNA-binding transcriptional ArsR family regulator/anti-sigma regulatory factor (Ser/Thr protein kinase)